MRLINAENKSHATNSLVAEPRFIRRTQVQKLTGLSPSSIYQLQREGNFPQAVQLSERRVAWVEHEVMDWINQRIAARSASSTVQGAK